MARAANKATHSQEHKAAIAAGQVEARIVRNYLTILDADSRPGRRRSPDTIHRRLATISNSVDGVDPLHRLQLIQERRNLEEELAQLEDQQDSSQAEADFVSVAAQYSERKGISYQAWRECGVSASVLAQAGIRR